MMEKLQQNCRLLEYGTALRGMVYLYDGCAVTNIVVSIIVFSEQEIPEDIYDWFDVRINDGKIVINRISPINFSYILLPHSVLATINNYIVAEKIIMGEAINSYLNKWMGLYDENERFSLMSGLSNIKYIH